MRDRSPDSQHSLSSELGVSNPEFAFVGVSRIDSGNTKEVEKWLETVSKPGRPLLIDLEQVDYITTDGFAALMRVQNKIKRNRGSVILLDTQPKVEELMNSTGLNLIFRQELSRR